MTPTQARVRELFQYEEATGIFRRRNDSDNRRWKSGRVCGWVGTGGYRYLLVDGSVFRASSIAWLYVTGRWPECEVDHENKNAGDDWFHNLRPATKSQNQWNKNKYARNTSGFKGVTWNKNHGKWQAQIGFREKMLYLGSFADPVDAASAYDREAALLFGEFAVLNFPLQGLAH